MCLCIPELRPGQYLLELERRQRNLYGETGEGHAESGEMRDALL